MKKKELVDTCLKLRIDYTGTAIELKKSLSNCLRLQSCKNQSDENTVDLTDKNQVIDYLSHDNLHNSDVVNVDEDSGAALLPLNAYYNAATTDNNLLSQGITKYNIESVAYIYNHLNIINSNVLLIGNKYLPNIYHQILQNDIVYDQPRLDVQYRQILLLGLGYPQKLKRQWQSISTPLDLAEILPDPFCAITLPSLGKFKHFNKKSKNMCHYSDSVKRDFLRALVVQDCAHPCDIYTVNKCEDNVRDSTEHLKMK